MYRMSGTMSIYAFINVVGSSRCEHVLRGPWHGGHRNHQAFYPSSGKVHQNLWLSHQDPRRGGLHHRLLRGHSGEPAAHWRVLQVRQHRCPSRCTASIGRHASVSSSQQLRRCRELGLGSGRRRGLEAVGSQLPHAGHLLEIETCT